MPSPYKLLILDYGGVYSFKYVMSNFNHIMMSSFGVTPNDAQKDKIASYSRLLGENNITVKEYITKVGSILEATALPSAEEFIEATMAVTNPPSEEMVELVKSVRASGVKVSLLSDMYMFEVVKTKPWGRYEGFDHVSFSAEAGMTKANPVFFQKTLDHFEVQPSEVLFVDDLAKNIIVGKSVGVATLHADKDVFANASELADKIYQLLNL